eukprot:7989692-Lingulodinium_polyedra.AAC.1
MNRIITRCTVLHARTHASARAPSTRCRPPRDRPPDRRARFPPRRHEGTSGPWRAAEPGRACIIHT